MYHWLLSNPYLTPQVLAGRDARAEALTRSGYHLFNAVWNLVDATITGGRRVAAALRARRDRHEAIANLHGLNDRLLKDIGIDRSEIRSVVEQLSARGAEPTGGQTPVTVDRIRVLQQAGGQAVDGPDNDNRGPALPRAVSG